MNRLKLALLWTLLIITACAWPATKMPVAETTDGFAQIKHLDKMIHAAIFFGFGFLWLWASKPGSRVVWVLIAGVVLGIGTELSQTLPIVGRDASWGDLAADIAGLVLGIGLGLCWTSRSGAGLRPTSAESVLGQPQGHSSATSVRSAAP